ncbi:MAG: MFS transporter [Planctomycetota bacterium]
MSRLLRAYVRSYEGLPARVWMLTGVLFVSRCGTMFMPFLAIFLRSELDYTPSEAGRMLACYGVGSVAGTYLGGWLAGRLGALRVMIGSLALGAPGFLVLPWVRSPEAIAATLLCLSVVREAIRPAIATATSDLCPAELHSKAFALNRLAFNLGVSVGAGLSAVLVGFGYAWLFGFNAVVGWVAAGLTLAVFGWQAPPPHPESVHADAEPGRSPWRDHLFLVFLALQWVAGLVFFQLIGALPMYWEKECGISKEGIGLLFVINTLLIVALEMPLTERLRSLAPLPLVGVGMGLLSLGFGLSALEGVSFGTLQLTGLPLAATLVLLWTAGEMLAAPFGMAFVASRGAGPTRSAYMGMNSASLSAANVAAPLLGTALYQQDARLPWLCCLALAVALPLAFLVLSRAPLRAAARAAGPSPTNAGA